jgi:RNA ligase (TIGR02306 family)
LKDPVKANPENYRLRTKRFKKQIAQGLILPLDAIAGPEGSHGKLVFTAHPVEYQSQLIRWVQEGDDLTADLGILKYEPDMPAQLRGVVSGTFPYFVPKTDETRIQSAPGVLTRRKGELVYAAEKLDGSSFTAWYYPLDKAAEIGLPVTPEDQEKGYVFGVASRNYILKYSEDNAFWRTAEKYELEKKLKELNRPIVIQGEMFGPGIQDNKLKRATVELRLFNVYDLGLKSYLSFDLFKKTVEELGLETAPILFGGPFVLDHTVEQLVTMSQFKSTLNKDVWAEGMVIRPVNESVEKDLGRFSFKVINPEFLLKFEE